MPYFRRFVSSLLALYLIAGGLGCEPKADDSAAKEQTEASNESAEEESEPAPGGAAAQEDQAEQEETPNQPAETAYIGKKGMKSVLVFTKKETFDEMMEAKANNNRMKWSQLHLKAGPLELENNTKVGVLERDETSVHIQLPDSLHNGADAWARADVVHSEPVE